MEYNVKLLTGDMIYSSKELGSKTFEIGHGGVESGLEEALLYLKLGDKAKLIIPSHLAFGLLGDQNKVPPRSTLVYDIEIVNLK
jgi:FKBP-type peptidyl-prolyl cis-trans isomerase